MLLSADCDGAVQDALGYERGARRSFSYTRRPVSTAPLSTAPATAVADPHSHANPLYGQEGKRVGCCTCKCAVNPQQALVLAAAWGHRLTCDVQQIFIISAMSLGCSFYFLSLCCVSHDAHRFPKADKWCLAVSAVVVMHA